MGLALNVYGDSLWSQSQTDMGATGRDQKDNSSEVTITILF